MAKQSKKTKTKKPAPKSSKSSTSGGRGVLGLLAAVALAVAATFFFRDPPEIPAPDTSAMEPQVGAKIAETRAGVERDIRSAAAWSKLGAVFQAHELFPEAAASYAQARALDAEDYRWPYLEAQCLKEMRELVSAREAVGQAIERNTRYAPLFVLQAELYEQEGVSEDALGAYERALAIDPSCAPAAYGVGRLRLAAGDVEASLKHLERAVALTPEAGAVHATLARVYRRLGDRETALRSAALARQLLPEVPLDDPVMASVGNEAVSVVGLQKRAVEAERRGGPTGAEALLRRMIALRPDEANLYYNLANNLSRQSRFEDAEVQYKEALARQPHHVSALINLGNVLSERGDLPEARQLFDRALSAEPGHAGALSSLGKLAVARGDMRTAIEYLEQAIEQDPDRADTHYILAQLLRGEGRGLEAVVVFKRALALSPERPDIRFDLAVTYAQQGDFRTAWSEIHLAEHFGGAPPPEFLAALRSQMPDPGIR